MSLTPKIAPLSRVIPRITSTPPYLLLHQRRHRLAAMSVSTAAEKQIQRNPHPDFKGVEASRPDWDTSKSFNYTKTADPNWSFGQGANSLLTPEASAKNHISINPYEEGRPATFNYKLLISSIVPRPIGFISTQSSDGTVKNLAPFSYFNVINHDPPLFIFGIAGPQSQPKDTVKNLMESKECVVNIISEHFIEAANICSIDAPFGVSEWDVSGLTPMYDCKDVKAPRVKEAVFSVECKLESCREFESRGTPGKKTGSLVVVEGTRFWVREDAINEDKNLVSPEVLRPMSRLGGITYGRLTEAMELTRPVFEKDLGGVEGYEKLKAQKDNEQQGKL